MMPPKTVRTMPVLFFFLLTSFVFIPPIQALGPQDFQWMAKLVGEARNGEAARVPLSATIISKTHSRFQDLRVFDSKGAEIPYVIYEDYIPAVPEQTVGLTVKEFIDSDTSEIFILEKAQLSEKIDSMELQTTARDFKKIVFVEVSTDSHSWSNLTKDVIFDFSSRVNLRKTTIPLPETGSRYFRVTIEKTETEINESDPIHLQYQDLVFSTQDNHAQRFKVDSFAGHSEGRKHDLRAEDSISIIRPQTITDKDGNSQILLGEINLPITVISFDVEDSYFYRPIEVQINHTRDDDSFRTIFHGIIHQIPGESQDCLDLKVDMDQAPFIRLIVRNGDNPPLSIQKINLVWNQRILYFHPREGETYSLTFGNKTIPSPNYETAHLISNDVLALRKLPEWKIVDLDKNLSFSPGVDESERRKIQEWVLNAVVILLLTGLAYWGVMLLNRISRTE